MTESQNRDLWFTLPPQRSLLVLWLFSAIPIPILKFQIFYSSSKITSHMKCFFLEFSQCLTTEKYTNPKNMCVKLVLHR